MCDNSTVITYGNTSDPRERWLWTQYIQKSVPAPDEYPVRVFVNVTVSPSTTSSINDSLELQIQHADRNESQIQYIDKDNPVQFYFDIAKGEDGFSLALKGPPTGMAIVSRVLVYRHECQPLGFARGPVIQAPVNGSVSVVPDCVENSHQSDLLKCTAEGHFLNRNSACQCDLGYYKVSSNGLPSCEGIQWNLSITDTIGESQFVRYREVSLVERFDILMTIITITVIYIHVVIIIHPL